MSNPTGKSHNTGDSNKSPVDHGMVRPPRTTSAPPVDNHAYQRQNSYYPQHYQPFYPPPYYTPPQYLYNQSYNQHNATPPYKPPQQPTQQPPKTQPKKTLTIRSGNNPNEKLDINKLVVGDTKPGVPGEIPKANGDPETTNEKVNINKETGDKSSKVQPKEDKLPANEEAQNGKSGKEGIDETQADKEETGETQDDKEETGETQDDKEETDENQADKEETDETQADKGGKKENTEGEEENDTEAKEDWEVSVPDDTIDSVGKTTKSKRITYSKELLLKFQATSKPTKETLGASERNQLTRNARKERDFGGRQDRGGPFGGKRGERGGKRQHEKRQNFVKLSDMRKPSENRWKRPQKDQDELKLSITRILNKIAPQTYESLLGKIVELGFNDITDFHDLVILIFEKAIRDSKYSEVYAKLCQDLNRRLKPIEVDGKELTLRKMVLNVCENGFRTREKPKPVPKEMTDPSEREDWLDKSNKLKDRINGMMIFIGELYMVRMVGGKHMMHTLQELIDNDDSIEELEIFSSLYKTLGSKLVSETKHQAALETLHNKMVEISKSKDFSPRIRFMFQDLLDLKANGFQERKKI